MKNAIIEKAINKKGQFAHLEWRRPCKTLKSCNSTIEKETIANNIRIGCGYDNLSTTIQGRADGTLPEENQGLKGKKWEVYPVLLTSLKNEEQQYIRVSTSPNTVFHSQYYINGKKIDKKDIEQFLQSSEKRASTPPTVFDVKLNNIYLIK